MVILYFRLTCELLSIVPTGFGFKCSLNRKPSLRTSGYLTLKNPLSVLMNRGFFQRLTSIKKIITLRATRIALSVMINTSITSSFHSRTLQGAASLVSRCAFPCCFTVYRQHVKLCLSGAVHPARDTLGNFKMCAHAQSALKGRGRFAILCDTVYRQHVQ
jgi:hypothetical protein